MKIMADVLTPSQRRRCMAAVRSTNTKPELIVRSVAHKLGYRFRLHRRDLPGQPDIVFPSRKKVVFVHGCFWHQHPGCRRAGRPATQRKFWSDKLDKNIRRDRRVQQALCDQGWRVLVIWECQVKHTELLASRLQAFLDGSN